MATGRRRDSPLSSVRSLANTLPDRSEAPERMHRIGRGPRGHIERTYVRAVRHQGQLGQLEARRLALTGRPFASAPVDILHATTTAVRGGMPHTVRHGRGFLLVIQL